MLELYSITLVLCIILVASLAQDAALFSSIPHHFDLDSPMDPALYTQVVLTQINDNSYNDLVFIYAKSVSKDLNPPNITAQYHHRVVFAIRIIFDLQLGSCFKNVNEFRNTCSFLKPPKNFISPEYEGFELNSEHQLSNSIHRNFDFPAQFACTVTDLNRNGRPDIVIVSSVQYFGQFTHSYAVKVVVLHDLSLTGKPLKRTVNPRYVFTGSESIVYSDVQHPSAISISIDSEYPGFYPDHQLNVCCGPLCSRFRLGVNGNLITSIGVNNLDYSIVYPLLSPYSSSSSFHVAGKSLTMFIDHKFLRFYVSEPSKPLTISGDIGFISPKSTVSLAAYSNIAPDLVTFVMVECRNVRRCFLRHIYFRGGLGKFEHSGQLYNRRSPAFTHNSNDRTAFLIRVTVHKRLLLVGFGVEVRHDVRNTHLRILYRNGSASGTHYTWPDGWLLLAESHHMTGRSEQFAMMSFPEGIELSAGVSTWLVRTNFQLLYRTFSTVSLNTLINTEELHVQQHSGPISSSSTQWPIAITSSGHNFGVRFRYIVLP
ncbi:hypothetical protein RCL1_005660 [Eukaryota sp. TZLM3-RCL]